MTRRGFVIRDLCFGLACLAIVASLLLVASGGARQRARAAAGQNQLRWMAGASSNYAADNADRFWSFSWQPGETYTFKSSVITMPHSPVTAAAYQAIDILYRVGGRDLPVPISWIPHPLYNHLPLMDYVGGELPNFSFISPADKYRLAWVRDPEAFARGEFLPFQPQPRTGHSERWLYTSSYLTPAAWWDFDNALYQGDSQRQYIIPSVARLGGALMTDVAFPSQKVMVHDQEQRERGAEPLYCIEEAARAPVLMADGSAGAPATADSNPGWHPAQKTLASPMRFRYDAFAWEAPPSTDPVLITGHYRWTRGGIAGRDFGGPEIDTGQP